MRALDPTLTIFYGIACVVSTIALALKVKVLMQQLRERRSELTALDEDVPTKHSRKLKIHKKRLVQTTRTIHMVYVSMMVGIAEGGPLGIFQGKIAQVLDCVSLDELVLMQLCFCCVHPKWI